ncbi:MAG: PEP/pyruvate-binding domain-containing protein [Candidatus Sifarchaeia archaeon]|jgi:pyruvate,water dikinase
MTLILNISEIDAKNSYLVGGKAKALARLCRQKIAVPQAICVTTKAYDQFLDSTGLRGRILFEIERKRFEDLRWEEMWDTSLRIQNMFLSTPLPKMLRSDLSDAVVNSVFRTKAVVVRSSSLQEDSAKASFAGLHESYVNVKGTEDIIKHIKLVWASLWSDAAILYRNELGLDVTKSRMAVIIQQFVPGKASGVIFTQAPQDRNSAFIEAVYGLNQGLVDGTIEPDQWLIDRNTEKITSHSEAARADHLVAKKSGVESQKLTQKNLNKAPLTTTEVKKVYRLGKKSERLFRRPQDVEWTLQNNFLYALQSRAITTAKQEKSDNRSWYLSLSRSLENLKVLRQKIEDNYIPQMIEQAQVWAEMEIENISDPELADELVRRQEIFSKWQDIYSEYFIPMAHGMRLFGQFYNRTRNPQDPHEFMKLLENTHLKSIERNKKLTSLAEYIRKKPKLAKTLEKDSYFQDELFEKELDSYLDKFSDLSWGISKNKEHREKMVRFLLEMAYGSVPAIKKVGSKKANKTLEQQFLNSFRGKKRQEAVDLLELARASYRLRDDDNIYLGRIENELLRVFQKAKKQLKKRLKIKTEALSIKETVKALKDPAYIPKIEIKENSQQLVSNIKARQLTGQPAGEGIAVGNARIINNSEELLEFKSGEIIVCDAIEPNMTFIIPMAKAIVERRGGMLIHGAIIAREYGLPCVTGVPNATSFIRTGSNITVDGYLGIVTINT